MGSKNGESDTSTKNELKTYKEEIRTGYYEQKIIIIDDKKIQQLTRYPKSFDKVTFGYIGTLEYYTYPFKFPDKVFASVHGDSTVMDKYEVPKMLAVMNKIRWYLNDGVRKSLNSKSKIPLAQQIRLAYEYARSKEVGQ